MDVIRIEQKEIVEVHLQFGMLRAIEIEQVSSLYTSMTYSRLRQSVYIFKEHSFPYANKNS